MGDMFLFKNKSLIVQSSGKILFFKIIEDEEDTSMLRQCFMNYILDNNRETLLLINKNLNIIITKYGNAHTIRNFKGRTPHIDQSNSDSGSNKDNTPKSKSSKSNNNNADFSSAVESQTKSQTRDGSNIRKSNRVSKKSTKLVIVYDDGDELERTKLSPIYVTAEHQSEVVYSDLL